MGPVFRPRGTATYPAYRVRRISDRLSHFGFAHAGRPVPFSPRAGAGGGTVGVIQAYVADTTDPKDRSRALGWLSATTNLGVALGPVLGSLAITLGTRDLMPDPEPCRWAALGRE